MNDNDEQEEQPRDQKEEFAEFMRRVQEENKKEPAEDFARKQNDRTSEQLRELGYPEL